MLLKKKRFIPQLSDITPSSEDFAHLLESVNTSHVKEGMVVKGQVVETNADVIVVDVGLKNEGRIAIITIGDCQVFSYVQSIANQLKIPYLTIKWENQRELQHQDNEEFIELKSSLNIHPPANRIIEAVIDLVNHYKWEYVTILYQVNNFLKILVLMK